MNTTNDRQRFIILADQRSGSCHLEYLLDSHRSARVAGELFNPDYLLSEAEELVQGFAALRREDPIGYLNEFFAQPFGRLVTHLGFRLFYGHARQNGEGAIWARLRRMKDLRVVHLQRRNLLSSLLSLKIALQSKVWMRPKGQQVMHYQPLSLDFDECVEYFRAREQNIKEAKRYYRRTATLDLFYEDLASDEEREVEGVLQFLGLESQALTNRILKQNHQKNTELILNYAHLETSFRGTKWHHFFED